MIKQVGRCATEGCLGADIEKGRRICKNCKRAQMRARATERRESDRVGYNARMREFRKTHPPSPDEIQKESERQAAKYLRDKEKINKRNSAWRKTNPARVAASTAKYRASRSQRTPAWLTQEQLELIGKLYALCSEMSKSSGIQYEVDHIVPIRGRSVSGLHVPWNLQIIPRSENRSKINKYPDPGTPT